MEFRLQSAPFSMSRPPPPAPWLPRDFIPVAQSGRFGSKVTAPAQALGRFLTEKGVTRDLYWLPELVLLSTRMRLHLDNKTQYGSGPNPDQAFIVSIDRVDVCEGAGYLRFLESGWYERRGRARPQIMATFFEMEIEFERNVSTRLDQAAKAGVDSSAQTLLSAFLEDQKFIKGILVNQFMELGLNLEGAIGSKYQHASMLSTTQKELLPGGVWRYADTLGSFSG